MSTATITWQIDGKGLVSFLNAKNNKIYKSNAFYLNGSNGSAKFMLECYSNGMNKGEEGSVDLFLKILSLPEHASDITLRYSLQCVETNTSFTKIKTFNRETTNSCWPYNTLQLSELTKLNIITFECDLQILSIKYKKTKSVIGTITNYFNSMNIKMTKYTSFTWNIHNIEYDNFMNCKCRKQINSPLFGGSDDDIHKFFQLECYPNGTKLDQRGNVVMGLSLLLLPPLISSIKLFYSFECIECNKEWSNVHNFSYNQSVKGWPIGLIKQDLLYKVTKKNKNITFKCNIEILKLYNSQHQEIHQKYWQRFIIDNTNQHKNASMRNSDSQTYDEKDIQIAKLTQNVISLQHTMDIMKKELYCIKKHTLSQKQTIQRPKLQMSHSDHIDRGTLENHRQISHIHSQSHNHFIPHQLPPLNGHEPEYNNYNNTNTNNANTNTNYKYPPQHNHNHYIQQPTQKQSKQHKQHRHPRSRSDIDQIPTYNQHRFEYKENRHERHVSERHERRGFYPYNNSQSHHEINYNNYNAGHSGHGHGHQHGHNNGHTSHNNINMNMKTFKKRKVHKSVNGLFDYKYNKYKNNNNTMGMGMSPLVDENVNENNYTNWYKNPYKKENKTDECVQKQRHKTDEGFAQNIRSFVEINDLVNNDLVKQMETQNQNNNPFFNDNSSIRINESTEEEQNITDSQSDNENKQQIIDENALKHMLKAKSMGTPKKIQEIFNNNKKNKSSKYKKSKHKQKQKQKRNKDKTKAFYRSQSEKKIHINNSNSFNYKPKNSSKPIVPRFIDEYDSNDDVMNYNKIYNKDYDKIKLKKWLCNDIGLNMKYYNLLIHNGYDNIDIVVELKENDLIHMGIHNKKNRIKLLQAFAKFNPFQQETIGAPTYI